ncbi:hypothetical protein AB0F17_33520 [Nonomuraea sp. NPDC026600]|uniref:WXG100-like domain-containing protein n=1 Tax=Nonomuraea sp. NPDC026600 TaxID=3155363 RepID=UPI0033F3DDA6
MKPWIGWVVGTDWPQGDEEGCFRLADACVTAAHQVVEGTAADDPYSARRIGRAWDGAAHQAFAEYVAKTADKQVADLAARLIHAAIKLNAVGVQIQYTKYLIEATVWLLVVQIGYLSATAVATGGSSLTIIPARLQLARLTVALIARMALINIALFAAIGAGMDAAVQYLQIEGGRRDGFDPRQLATSAATGGLMGLFKGGLAGGLTRLSTPALANGLGLSRAEMRLREKLLAAATHSVYGQAAQYGLAGGLASMATMLYNGDLDWTALGKTVLSSALGADGQHLTAPEVPHHWNTRFGDPRFEAPLRRLDELDPGAFGRLHDGVNHGRLRDTDRFAEALDSALASWQSPKESVYAPRPRTGEFISGSGDAEPVYLARGGEHLVYELHDSIVKIDHNTSAKVMDWRSPDFDPDHVKLADVASQMLDILRDKEHRYTLLRDLHGAHHVADQHSYVRDIKWPGRVINEIVGAARADPERIYEMPAIVTVQHRYDGLETFRNPDLATGYAETANRNPPADVYLEAGRRWLENVGPARFDQELFLDAQRSPSLNRLFLLAQDDAELMTEIRRFASNALHYSQVAGETMDMVGRGNVVFLDSRSYVLVDALHPYPVKRLSEASRLLGRLDGHEELTRRDRIYLLNVLNYVRTVNALAHLTGLDGRLDVVPPGFNSRSWLRFQQMWKSNQ